MPDDRITNAKDLLKQVSDFGERMKERRRHERKKLLWAATVEVRGQRFEGMIVDLSAGGARIKFDAAVSAGDELTLVLKQLDELGAKVVWQREGEAGLQFLLAPEEVAARIQQKLPMEAIAAEARSGSAPVEPAASLAAEPAPASAPASTPSSPPAARPASTAPRRRATLLAAAVLAGLGGLIGGSVVVAHSFPSKGPSSVLAFNGGASGQHSCSNLLNKVGDATNQVDFSLNVASAVQAKCLDIHHLGPSANDRNEGMVSATKVPLH